MRNPKFDSAIREIWKLQFAGIWDHKTHDDLNRIAKELYSLRETAEDLTPAAAPAEVKP